MFPELIVFDFAIPMYPLLVATGFLTGTIIADILCKRFSITENESFILMCYTEIGVIIGGKLLYLLINIHNIKLYYTHYGFLGIFTKSGFVYYGGLFGGILLVYIFSKIHKKKFINCTSLVFTITPLIHAFGRIGCFCSGCCYGKEWNGLFSVFLHDAYRFPVQLLESGLNLILFFVLLFIVLKSDFRYVNFLYMFIYGIIRIICEFFRGDIQRGFFLDLSISTWISFICLIFGAIGFLIFKKKKKNE